MKTNRIKKAVRFAIFCMVVTSSVGLWAQCPEITIDEKYDHVQSAFCRAHNWDTMVNCINSSLVLNATPFITAQHFNGQYQVEQIPYNPVDTTFHAGQHLNISTDDAWENSPIQFPFTFIYFGYPYTQAVVGSNGLVSFSTSTYVGQHCAYMYDVPIPSPTFPSLNAIYGVYEDIDPGGGITSTQGMFRSVGGEYPCRYLCASVNGVPLYPWSDNTNNRCTYQIVCYEGTNIIEVHIKQRSCCSATNSGKGLVGIQNATGSTQESHFNDPSYFNDIPAGNLTIKNPTFYIQPNSPGAFVAPDRGSPNGWTGTTTYEAWRFTPLGETSKNISWWRLFEDEDGNVIDSVEFTNLPGDTNGYYLNNDHTQVSVTPTRTTRYMVKCIYGGANGYRYGMDGISMHDTITVGMDTARTMTLHTDYPTICEGQRATVTLSYPTQDQILDSCTWSAMKEFNGVRTVMPASAINPQFTSVQLNSQLGQLTQNHIDSVWIFCTTRFKNGCNNYDSILIRTYPNFNIYDTMGVCQGESYDWCGYHLTQPCDTSRHYWSQPDCDSTMHLHFVVSDLSYNTDYVLDCKPHTWLNGKTYYQDNTDTRDQDTITLKNKWDCDSIVTLDFHLVPMKAIISHTPEVATLDELTIELRDDSYGHDSHRWLLPDGKTSQEPETSIIFPLKGTDTMTVKLAVHNDYGCDDTATSVIPLHKVSQFVPNIFTPDRDDNNRFAPKMQGNVSDVKVWIYNRRGELVCKFQGPDGYWDGTDLNGNRCSQGAYVYTMRFRTTLDPTVTQELSGTITLIR